MSPRRKWTAWPASIIARIPRLGRLPGGRAWWWIGGAIGAFAVGYIVAATALFPAPIFAATTAVPRLVGLERDRAESVVLDANLTTGAVQAVSHPEAPRGNVVWQDPPPGVAVSLGFAVDLSVSSGPRRIPVPDLIGYDASIAEQLLQATGLSLGRTEPTQAPAPRGVVINSRPPAGTTLLPGTEVTLVVSVGAPTITVPDLTGLAQEEADALLAAAGLALGTTVRRRTSQGVPGTIIAQDPAPHTLSSPGTAVNVTLVRRESE
jgi:serine/threonine-protein kinase